MQPPATSGNRTIDALPGPATAETTYVYREAPWIALPIRVALAAIGLGLAFLAVRGFLNEPLAFDALFAAGSGLLVFGAIYRHAKDPINFICGRDGLYFPELSRVSRRPGRWLFVPWKNILDYRVQRMLDETSSLGIVLVILANRDEETVFLRGHRIFNLAALRDRHAAHAVRIGFSTFRPSPQEILRQLQTYEAMPKGADRPEERDLNRAT